MMYPRLALLREFLRDDGVIVVHIDEHEHASLSLLLDEILGRRNSLGTIVWDKGNPKGDATGIACQHETLVCYARNRDFFNLSHGPISVPKTLF
jgi:adenine-specific DNA-methyltransferase